MTSGVIKAGAALAAAAALSICCLVARQPAAPAAADTVSNWGLSFRENGKPPVGNASGAYLAQYHARYLADTEEKILYLTFDAGYENGHTAAILDTLGKHQVSACFFVVGHYVESAPELVCRMVQEGHVVGNHTWSHPDMSAIEEPEAFAAELQKLEDAYRELTGQQMIKLYRPPQGKCSAANLAMAKDLGYTTVFWSLAYVDWYTDKQPTRDTALQKLVPRIHPGAVVLLHSTSATNAAVLDEVLTKWEALGYTFGDPHDLLFR